MNKESSDKPSVPETKTKTKASKNKKENPAIRFIGELDDLTRSDLNILVNDPAYDFIFNSLNFVNNLQREKEKK
jgi:hypothetical protein